MLHLGAVVHTFLRQLLPDVFLLDLCDCLSTPGSTGFASVILVSVAFITLYSLLFRYLLLL